MLPLVDHVESHLERSDKMKNDMTSKQKKDTITIKIEVPITEYEIIKKQAKEQQLTLKEYCLTKLMDHSKGAEEIRREIIKSVPVYYNHVNQVTNRELQQFFFDFGGKLCRL